MQEVESVVLKKAKRDHKNPPPKVKNIDGTTSYNERPNKKENQPTSAFNMQQPSEKSWEHRFSHMIEKALGTGGQSQSPAECRALVVNIVSYLTNYSVDIDAIINHLTSKNDEDYRKEIYQSFTRYDLGDVINIFCQHGKAYSIDYFVAEMEHVKMPRPFTNKLYNLFCNGKIFCL